ncbi:hypothetical protein VSDG_07091 [Cytospora chrysosperma]|uniref:Uncharacterized protein n=1 Tax=Cytospora chrysosperma TaxID=252740 RepID=A0A423VV84_CYTCH|nr:hypothetical protein VSDG_07091 [Valsa sordida]
MSPHRVLTPEASPEPELPQCKGLWQATTHKHKPSWPAMEASGGVRALWENKWRSACQKSTHPFQDGRYEDFEPIFDDLIEGHIDDPNSPEYTLTFLPRAQELASEAEDALLRGDRILATEFYLRACAVLRVARCPSPARRDSACPARQEAWQLQKALYLRAGRLWESPVDEAVVPHIYDTKTHPHQQIHGCAGKAGWARPRIPTYVRLPMDTLRAGRPCPAVLIVSDDRTSHTAQCEEALARGWGCVVVEVPGAGDCPVSPSDDRGSEGGEAAADEVWSSVLDWMRAIRVFDMGRVAAWGLGEAVVRLAATHGDRLRGCVAMLGRAGGRDLSMLDEISCRLLLVTESESTVQSNGLWTPVVEGRDEGKLALFEYGVPGTSVVQYPVADMRTVYKWVGDVVS